ncbi:unnamed protein product, partial [Staurois parvus]
MDSGHWVTRESGHLACQRAPRHFGKAVGTGSPGIGSSGSTAGIGLPGIRSFGSTAGTASSGKAVGSESTGMVDCGHWVRHWIVWLDSGHWVTRHQCHLAQQRAPCHLARQWAPSQQA